MVDAAEPALSFHDYFIQFTRTLSLPFALASALAFALVSEIGPGFSPDIQSNRRIGL
jgi:hypothetical protein